MTTSFTLGLPFISEYVPVKNLVVWSLTSIILVQTVSRKYLS